MKNPKNLLIVTYFSYNDALTQTFTLPYIKIIRNTLPEGSKLFFTTLEQPKFAMSKEDSAKVKAELASIGINWISFPYKGSGLLALVSWCRNLAFLYFLCFKEKINFIHGWCTTAGSLAYLLSVATNKPLVIDSYEPHAESMVENGTWKRNSLLFKTVFYLEKKLSHRAQFIIAATAGMKSYAKDKYQKELNKYWVKPSCVNLNLFSKEQVKNAELIKQYNLEDKIVCVYAGKFGSLYLEHEVFDFFKVAEQFWKNKFRVVLLTSHTREEILAYCISSNLDPSVVIQKFVSHAEVPSYMGLGDFAITPIKPVPSKRYCTPIKNGEYWAMGLPVVITPNISDDSEIIENEKIGAVLNSLTKEEYLIAIKNINEILTTQTREEIYTKITKVAKKYRSFEIAEKVYAEVYGTK